MSTVDFGWLWHVCVGSSIVTSAPLWWGTLTVGEVMHVWGQGSMGNLCTATPCCCDCAETGKSMKQTNKQRNKCVLHHTHTTLKETITFQSFKLMKNEWKNGIGYQVQNRTYIHIFNFWSFKRQILPWLVWLSGLSAGLRTKRLLVRFPVRAHAWVVGQIPSRGYSRSNHTLMLPSFSFSLPSPLFKNK